MQGRDNGNNCMYTVLYTAVLGYLLVIKEQIIITVSSNISTETKSSDTVKCL